MGSLRFKIYTIVLCIFVARDCNIIFPVGFLVGLNKSELDEISQSTFSRKK